MTCENEGLDLTATALSWAPERGIKLIDDISFSIASANATV